MREDPAPSPWVARHGERLGPGSRVLDVACGRGRHLRHFLARGCRVTGIDVDVGGVADLAAGGAEIVRHDLEDGSPWPLGDARFDAVVVIRYLHRPLLPRLVAAVDGGGLLIYETFARGHERLGRPRNPDFLLRPGELLEAVRGELRVLAYEEAEEGPPAPARLQRIAAVRDQAARGGVQGRSWEREGTRARASRARSGSRSANTSPGSPSARAATAPHGSTTSVRPHVRRVP